MARLQRLLRSAQHAGLSNYLIANSNQSDFDAWGIGDISTFNYRRFLAADLTALWRTAPWDHLESLQKVFHCRMQSATRSTAPPRTAERPDQPRVAPPTTFPNCRLIDIYNAYLYRESMDHRRLEGSHSVPNSSTLFSGNSYNLDVLHLMGWNLYDFFGPEVNYLNHFGREAPHAAKIADALGKPMVAVLPGPNYDYLDTHSLFHAPAWWTAQTYAFGRQLSYAHFGWATEGNYTSDAATHRPVFNFVLSNPELFDGFEPVEQVAVLVDSAATRVGKAPAPKCCRRCSNTTSPQALSSPVTSSSSPRCSPPMN